MSSLFSFLFSFKGNPNYIHRLSLQQSQFSSPGCRVARFPQSSCRDSITEVVYFGVCARYVKGYGNRDGDLALPTWHMSTSGVTAVKGEF